ncbi:MAG: hypothetical protein WD000_09915 [Thermodesulfobacteriota bacterium]
MRIFHFVKLAVLILLLPPLAYSEIKPTDWIGTYQMNHDGWRGTLVISDSKSGCTTSPWCSFVVSYINDKGVSNTGTIDAIDQQGQHMVFYLDFPENKQKFDGYIFSWDKSKMAGTTYWHGRTFGFYAVKTGPASKTQPGSIIIKAAASPDKVDAGKSALITVSALAPDGKSPVSGASVKIATGGGFFEEVGTNSITGYTDNNGMFRAIWRTQPKGAYQASLDYVFSIEVIKAGYETSRGETVISVIVK